MQIQMMQRMIAKFVPLNLIPPLLGSMSDDISGGGAKQPLLP